MFWAGERYSLWLDCFGEREADREGVHLSASRRKKTNARGRTTILLGAVSSLESLLMNQELTYLEWGQNRRHQMSSVRYQYHIPSSYRKESGTPIEHFDVWWKMVAGCHITWLSPFFKGVYIEQNWRIEIAVCMLFCNLCWYDPKKYQVSYRPNGTGH